MKKIFILIASSLILPSSFAMLPSRGEDTPAALIERQFPQIEIPVCANYYNYYSAIYAIKNQMQYLLSHDKYKKGKDALIGLIKEEFSQLGMQTTQGMILETYDDAPQIIYMPAGSIRIFKTTFQGENGGVAFFNDFKNTPADNPTIELISLTPDDKEEHIKKSFWIKRVHDVTFPKPEINRGFTKKDEMYVSRTQFLKEMWEKAKNQHETIFKTNHTSLFNDHKNE